MTRAIGDRNAPAPTHTRPALRALLVLGAGAYLVGGRAEQARGWRDTVDHRPAPSGRSVSEAAVAMRNGSAPPVDSSVASCFRAESVLVYASKASRQEPTGTASGTRVTFRRGPRRWTGVSVGLGGQPRRPAVLQELRLDAARGRVSFLVPRRAPEPWVVQGRIDCDSLWATGRPRHSKQEPSPFVLRRARTAR